MFAGLRDLVLPAVCPGCRTAAGGGSLCEGCRARLDRCAPRPVRPDPVPPGLPPCHAVGPYGGLLKDVIIGYKERGRYGLARPLGERLASSVAVAVPGSRALLLVPVPSTAQAVRRRRGDHLLRLARQASRRLAAAGREVSVLHALRVRARPDSAGLSALDRARLADAALAAHDGVAAVVERLGVPGSRPAAGARLVAGAGEEAGDGAAAGDGAGKSAVSDAPAVVVVDDVMTTGATIAAACRVLRLAGVRVDAAAVLAATERRHRHPW